MRAENRRLRDENQRLKSEIAKLKATAEAMPKKVQPAKTDDNAFPERGATKAEVASMMIQHGFKRSASHEGAGLRLETWELRRGMKMLLVTMTYDEDGKLTDASTSTVGY